MTLCWPFMPKSGTIVEALEWGTHVQRSLDGSEERSSYRSIPRQELAMTHDFSNEAYGRARELARRSIEEELYVPVWFDRVETGAINQGQVSFPVDATHRCFKEGGKVLLWGSDLSYEVRSLSVIGEGTIQTDAAIRAYNNAVAVPLRLATFQQEFSANRAHPTLIPASVRFETAQTEDLSGEDDGLVYPTYRDHDLVTTPRFSLGGSEETILQNVDVLDPRTGAVWKRSQFSEQIQASAIAWAPQSHSEVWALRVWLHNQRGQQKGFWTTSWNDDLLVTAAIAEGASTIEIQDCNLASYYSLPLDFAIQTAGGYLTAFRVTSVTAGTEGHEVLHLDGTFPYSLQPGDIVKTSKLAYCRFNTDRIEIAHRFVGAAKVVAPVVETSL